MTESTPAPKAKPPTLTNIAVVADYVDVLLDPKDDNVDDDGNLVIPAFLRRQSDD